jgi:Ca2+-binding RTX toxin-like protein
MAIEEEWLKMSIVGTNNPETINGTSGDDIIFGLGGNDVLNGLAGNDNLIGGTGADTMDGGAGSNLYEVDNSGDVVLAAAGVGLDIVYAQVNWVATPGSEIEALAASGSGQEQLTGNLHSDSYSMSIGGNEAVNLLSDGGGRADLHGGYGSDVYVVTNALTVVQELDGTEGFDGGHGGDPIIPAPDPLAEGYDTVRTSLSSYTLPDNVEKLVYFSFPGGPQLDFAGTGNAEANDISGGGGNDTLDGGASADRLTGGSGNDTYYFDNTGDYAVEQPGGGYDTIYTSIGTKASPNVESLIYTGMTGATLYAASSGTSIVGGVGNDKIWGGAGNDTLDGGLGSSTITITPNSISYGDGVDTLFGGAGSDTFVFHPVSGNGVDRILDYTPGVDHLAISDPFLSPSLFDFTTVAPQPLDPFNPGHNFAQILYYDQAHGALYYVDGTDVFANEKPVATFDNHPTLSASDFIFT